MLARTLVAVILLLAVPGASTAMAAHVGGPTGGTPVFDAAVGETNVLTVTEDPAASTVTFDDANAITTDHPNCIATAGNVTCTTLFTNFSDIVVNLGDGNDETTYVNVEFTVTQDGGAGADTLRSAPTGFTNSFGGTENDILIGPASPAGSAFFSGDAGADLFQGGPGFEEVTYFDRGAPVTVTLDGTADDGEAGEGDNADAAINDIVGGAGSDALTGSAANNTLVGNAGNDTLNGGEGDDTLDGGTGADDYTGGPGVDSAFLSASGPAPLFTPLDITVTLDDVANDGAAGEGDNVRSDVEDVSTAGGNDSLTGNASFNVLTGGGGNDTIDGGGGSDLLAGDSGDDTLRARDGTSDRVACGPGNDTAVVDSIDVLSSCETVDSAAVVTPPAVAEDMPPNVAFTAPGLDALIPSGGADVTVDASDDRGVARVVLIDDGLVVGTDTTAPYSFRYQPKAEDVGRNTLIAVAVDTSNQTDTAIRRVRVNRFRPLGLSQRVTPSRDRSAPFRFRSRGTLVLPTGVTAAEGCRGGTVSVQVKRGTRTISTRRVTLRGDCSYSSTVIFRDRSRLGNGRLRFTARFLGNQVLGPRSARSATARAG